MKVRIIKCSDSRLWYSKLINEVVLVQRIDNKVFWVRENDEFAGWNWIYQKDCEEYKEVN